MTNSVNAKHLPNSNLNPLKISKLVNETQISENDNFVNGSQILQNAENVIGSQASQNTTVAF